MKIVEKRFRELEDFAEKMVQQIKKEVTGPAEGAYIAKMIETKIDGTIMVMNILNNLPCKKHSVAALDDGFDEIIEKFKKNTLKGKDGYTNPGVT